MKKISDIFEDREASGVYALAGAENLGEIAELAAKRGYAFFHLAGAAANDKQQFLKLASETLGFPEYFGHNWDAFEDCITDMAWHAAPGYVILYDQFEQLADNAPGEFQTMLQILKDAAEAWKKDHKAMYVILSGKPGGKWQLKSVRT